MTTAVTRPTLPEIKVQCRIDHNYDDYYLSQLETLKKQQAQNVDLKVAKAIVAAQETADKMKELAKPAIDVVKNDEVKFVPKRYEKTYFNWMENIKDWCISRQLWWGHRIPAYYCDECGEIVVAKAAPEKCPKCGGTHLTQDEDTLDTWFSSALWPFSTLGWPEKTEELDYFYPTDVLVTGYDIITFWVSRMIFQALENTDQIPFKTVIIHGLVRDELGRKIGLIDEDKIELCIIKDFAFYKANISIFLEFSFEGR